MKRILSNVRRVVPVVALAAAWFIATESPAQYNHWDYDYGSREGIGYGYGTDEWRYDAPYYDEREWLEPRGWFDGNDYEYDPYVYNRSWRLDYDDNGIDFDVFDNVGYDPYYRRF